MDNLQLYSGANNTNFVRTSSPTIIPPLMSTSSSAEAWPATESEAFFPLLRLVFLLLVRCASVPMTRLPVACRWSHAERSQASVIGLTSSSHRREVASLGLTMASSQYATDRKIWPNFPNWTFYDTATMFPPSSTVHSITPFETSLHAIYVQ